MIVVDTNVVAYLHLPGERTAEAGQALHRDPDWHAPLLWRSELRNVFATVIRRDEIELSDARRLMRTAESLLEGREHFVPSDDVLALAASSGRSAYDCEFVALARVLGVPLVTADSDVSETFPETAVDLRTFALSEGS